MENLIAVYLKGLVCPLNLRANCLQQILTKHCRVAQCSNMKEPKSIHILTGCEMEDCITQPSFAILNPCVGAMTHSAP